MSVYKRLEDVPPHIVAAYDEGIMLIPREAFSGFTGAWTKLDWINVSRMPSPPAPHINAVGFRWVLTEELDAKGFPLYRATKTGE